MKIIHCADLHIDCKFKNLSKEKRESKRFQLLQNFVALVDYAEKNEVNAILLCGDIFDNKNVLKKSLKVLQDTILGHKNIKFFYINGNHDENVEIFDREVSNFYAFGKDFSKVNLGDVCIGGISFHRQFPMSLTHQVVFEKEKFNILLLHGSMIDDQYCEAFKMKSFADRNIDYVALGHIHNKSEGKIDKRGIWAYSGCLEAVDFGSVGKEFGFYELEIKDGKFFREFVPFSEINFQVVELNVSGVETNDHLFKNVQDALAGFAKKDIVKLVLTGRKKEYTELNFGYVAEKYKNTFFNFELEDKTKTVFDMKKYASEKLSLKAEFINMVMAEQNLSDEEKEKICNVGIEVLKGEDISL